MRGATRLSKTMRGHDSIPTHAPHAGSDTSKIDEVRESLKFQPTLPMRGATHVWTDEELALIFQPTLPMRGATTRKTKILGTAGFQPTLPMRGATIVQRASYCFLAYEAVFDLFLFLMF